MVARWGVCSDAGKLLVLGFSMACASLPAFGGDWKITPTLALSETATDNVGLTQRQAKSDLVTDINPGIRIEGSGGRSKLRFDYQMHNLIYAQDSSRNEIQNALNAFGTLEALEDWFFIDASGVISQQSISPYGASPTSSSVDTSTSRNTTETSTYHLTPYIRGSFGSFADYKLRYDVGTTSSKSNQAFDSDTKELVASLKGVTRLSSLGWSLDASTLDLKYGSGRQNQADRIRGVLSYQYSPQLQLSLIGGQERNDYQTLSMESNTTSGAGFEWAPTERTQIKASRENRFFGPSNTIYFSHRTAGTAWRYSETKDVSVTPNQQTSVNYELLNNMYSTSIPDPVARAKFITESLRLSGIDPNNQNLGGYLTTGATLEHRRELSFALIGARNTITFAASQSQSEALTKGSGTGIFVGELFVNAQDIEQRSASVNWSHKLTPLSTLIGTVARLNSTGTGGSKLDTTEQRYNLGVLTQLGPKTNASLGVRRISVSGTTSYDETAVTGTVSHQF